MRLAMMHLWPLYQLRFPLSEFCVLLLGFSILTRVRRPLWQLNAQHQPMHTGPQSPSVLVALSQLIFVTLLTSCSPVWSQDCRAYSNQAIPQFAPGPANSPCANTTEAGWNIQLPFRGETPLSFHEGNDPMPTSDQGLTQTADADTQSWVHDLDAMAIDASNWYI